MALKQLLVVLCVVYFVNCENAKTNSTDQHAPVGKSSRKSRQISSYFGMISCAMKYDVSCFVDAAENYLEERRTELLAEADAAVARATGRSSPANKPSHLADMVGKLISELVNMFQNGISGYFKSAREADDDDLNDIDDGENDLTDGTTTDSNGEMREIKIKKKKKKPLKSLIRLIKVALIAIIVVLKLAILLKVLQTAMQFKFLLISIGGFAIQGVKLWMTLRDKKNQHGQGHEEIVYKQPDDYSGPGGAYGGGGEYNAARSAQHLAYIQQRAM